MTIRSTIILLTMPLFLGLALVNGALLYFQDRSEMQQALNDQALAAAVTVAEFVREMHNPHTDLARPVRKKALQAALHHVSGIDGLYLLSPHETPLALKASHGWDPATSRAPATLRTFASVGEKGDRWVTALVPAGQGRFVAARFNAQPIHDHMQAVYRDVFLIGMVLALLATGLGLFVARRITRELDANRRQLAGHADDTGLHIREAQNLADALRLMRASHEAADARRNLVAARKARLRDPQQAVAEMQAALFTPFAVRKGQCEIAMRLCGEVPAGAFFAHVFTETGGTAVIGICRADTPVDALAAATDTRRLIEHCTGAADLQRAFGRLPMLHAYDVLERFDWTCESTAEPHVLAVTDEATSERVRSYCRNTPGIAPGPLLASGEVMLSPDGVFAIIGPAGSHDGGDRGLDIGFDSKDGAKPTDIKHFTH
ncbi:MAG: hypothetical protein P8Y48_00115 [Novosphingobium sp.]